MSKLFGRWRYFAERNARDKGRLARGRTAEPTAQTAPGFNEAKLTPGYVIRAKVTRADGTVEDLGIIARQEPPPVAVAGKL